MLSEYKDKLSGDGRCNSPGKSAKYCTYSLTDSETNKIVYMDTVDKRDVALKSPIMEREGFKKSMDTFIRNGVKISEVVTDASTQVISTMGKVSLSSVYAYTIYIL